MKRVFLNLHKALLWTSLAAVFCWAISGISHPMMAWLGPQAAKMRPPSFVAEARHITQLQAIIDTLPVREAVIAKLVATEVGETLQITTDERAPRRYFSLEDGVELIGHDEAQARWLTTHYLNVPMSATKILRYRTEFDSSYPRVNRLLPVYEVSIERGDESLRAYIYTETGVLASLSNSDKERLQWIFQNLHTWKWLDVAGFGRVLVIALFMVSLLAMASSGLYLLVALKRRAVPDVARRWHRRIAYLLLIPLFAWSSSGFYHLLQSEYVEPVSGIRLGGKQALHQFAVDDRDLLKFQKALESSLAGGARVSSISLVSSSEETPLYRVAFTPQEEEGLSGEQMRQKRFDGIRREMSVFYLNAASGSISSARDAKRVEEAALMLMTPGDGLADIAGTQIVTRFGPGYDFRNKRLPVWQVDFDDAAKTRVFIDPVTAIVVDQSRQVDRLESLSFSLLHKWNFMTPFLGRFKRDVLVVITLLTLMVLASLGLLIRVRRQRQRSEASAPEHGRGIVLESANSL